MIKKLLQFRKKIDKLDAQLIKILTKRAKIVAQVAKLKQAQNNPPALFIKPDRELEMLQNLEAKVKNIQTSFLQKLFTKNNVSHKINQSYKDDFYKALFRLVISASNHLEQPNFTVFYFDESCLGAIYAYYGAFCKAVKHSSFYNCLENCNESSVISAPALYTPNEQEIMLMQSKNITFFANTSNLTTNINPSKIAGIIL
jgi:chorismate mutase